MDARADAVTRPESGACVDLDDDGHQSAACGGDDCDDSNPRRYPGNREVCDTRGLDEDCDPCTVSEVTALRIGGDGDRDEDSFISINCFNVLNAGDGVPVCAGALSPDAGAGDGGVSSAPRLTVSATEVRGTDCADDPIAGGGTRFPGAAEICNNLDDNCVNGTMDESRVTFYRDADGDGFGDRNATGTDVVSACTAPMGYVRLGTDCNDANAMISPGAREVCDVDTSIDENCNDRAEEGCACPAVGASRACCSGRGTETCRDMVGGARWDTCTAPLSAERCNGIDDNCDGNTDEGLTIQCYPDTDDDGYAASGATLRGACPGDDTRLSVGRCPTGFTNRAPATPASTDCADADPTRFPGNAELCDGVDNDCDGSTPDDARDARVGTLCALPGGGVGRCMSGTNVCLGGAISCRANTALPELCNGMDDDCDGVTDEPLCADSQSAPTGYGACVAGSGCAVSVCVDGRGNCDGNAFNGCEVDLRGDRANCGGCGVRCLMGACEQGVCREPPIVELSAGESHTCGRAMSGQVVCWGSNGSGRLGDGTTNASGFPVLVTGVSDAVEIATGVAHTCARRASGQVLCWGSNGNGQLGDGTTTTRLTPTLVPGLTDAVEIAAGGQHTCARRANGQIVCWGVNAVGQLGDGTTTNRTTPVTVSALAGAVELVAGNRHSCARTMSGQVLCWGDNSQGQLADAIATNRTTPVVVAGLTTAVELSAGGAHNCARLMNRTLMCWGDNGDGQIGDGTTSSSRRTPTPVVMLTMVDEVDAGGSQTCARSGAQVYCWGRGNLGQLGNGSSNQRETPVPVSTLSDALELTVGNAHACARRASGWIACWGSNTSGQIGDGTTNNRFVPTTVLQLANATKIVVGVGHSCARRMNGELACWGDTMEGEFDASAMALSVPMRVDGVSDAISAAAGDSFTCALRANGAVLCRGRNDMGQLGDGTTAERRTFVAVSGLTDAVELVAGTAFVCARRASGAVVCWGTNNNGQLGDGTMASRTTPVAVAALTDAVELVAGATHACVRRANGQALCWGNNSDGQLGDGTMAARTRPTAIPMITDFVQLSAGLDHTCGRRSTGAMLCWGNNSSGQLGDGTNVARLAPTLVSGASNIVDIAAGTWFSCAIRAGGAAQCWGNNTAGQLGTGASTPPNTVNAPASLPMLTDAVQLRASSRHACALRATGRLTCWGSNILGRLGDGTTTNSTSPVVVRNL